MPPIGSDLPSGLAAAAVEVAPVPREGFAAFVHANAAFLLAGVLLSFTSSFGQTFFISLFAGEIMRDFGLSDGQWGLTYTLATGLSAVAIVWAGGLMDRFRIRRLAVGVAFGLAASCLAMAGAGSASVLVAVVFALRLFGLGLMGQLSIVAMARWFVASRGRALAVSSMGFALGQAVLPVAFVALLSVVHWRTLWVLAAVLVLAPLPLVVRLLRAERTPQSLGEDPQAPGMDGRQWTRGQMMRAPVLWCVVPLLLGPPAFGTALFFHQVHLTQAKGWALVDYVALLPLYTATAVAATFAAGAWIDRVGSSRPMATFLLPYAASFAIMAQATTLWGAAAALLLFGIGSGMQATVPPAFVAEYFGTRHLGAIKATVAAAMVFGTAVGPGLTGALIDAGFALPAQMPAIAAYFAAAALLAALGIARARPRLGTA